MARSTTQYVCQNCGATSGKWAGRCEQCGEWNTLVETAAPAAASKRRGSWAGNAASASVPTQLSAVDTSKRPRITSGFAQVDQVLGGGIVPGSVMLLSGDPGIGKSTLVLQLAAAIGSAQPVLYVSGEESDSQIKLRAERLGLGDASLQLLTETSVETIAATIQNGQYGLVIIDSIQTMASDALTGGAGSVGQVTASAQILTTVAKQHNSAMLIIGHVTKEGTIAGPKVLEHLVDVVLYLEGDRHGSFKALRGVKNRFGSTSEVAIMEMTDKGLGMVENPSEAMLAERQIAPGSVVLATMEGSRPLLVEVQALCSKSPFGYPKRAASGFDLSRLNVLIAVLMNRAGLDLSDQDIYVNIVGGLKLTEPAADLAIILSIASAFIGKPIKSDMIVFGEVGLSGEVRSVGYVSSRLTEAKKLGFKGAVGPRLKGASQAVSGTSTVKQAISTAFGV